MTSSRSILFDFVDVYEHYIIVLFYLILRMQMDAFIHVIYVFV